MNHILRKLTELKTQYQKDYDAAGMASDGETGVHNDYEQGKEDALKEITEMVTEYFTLEAEYD